MDQLLVDISADTDETIVSGDVATLIGLGFFGYAAQKSGRKRTKAILDKARAAEGEKS